MMPTPVAIKSETMSRLRELAQKQLAIKQMVEMIQQQCESKIISYNLTTKIVWEDIVEETGVNLETVMWVPHPTEDKIVPVQVKVPSE